MEYEPVSLFNNHKNILEANADAYSKFIVEAKTAVRELKFSLVYKTNSLKLKFSLNEHLEGGHCGFS